MEHLTPTERHAILEGLRLLVKTLSKGEYKAKVKLMIQDLERAELIGMLPTKEEVNYLLEKTRINY